MSDKPVDILFIVPNQYLARHRRIIWHTIWAVGSKKTYTVMSGDEFDSLYGNASIEDKVAALQSLYAEIVTFGDLSKREQVAYERIIDACKQHAMAAQQTQLA